MTILDQPGAMGSRSPIQTCESLATMRETTAPHAAALVKTAHFRPGAGSSAAGAYTDRAKKHQAMSRHVIDYRTATTIAISLCKIVCSLRLPHQSATPAQFRAVTVP